MAGHSKWANIKHRKGAQDKKRASLFTKLAREIIVAAKMGQPDPAFNPRLRAAIATAKSNGLPKDRIENSIKKGAGELGNTEDYEEMRYEGYAPGGVALIIDCLTDNRNRTAADVRAILNKAGGSMGSEGSVQFMFDRVGLITYPAKIGSADAVFEAAVEAGADNVESDEQEHNITTTPDDLHAVAGALAEKFGDAESVKLDWQPKTTTPIDGEVAESVIDLIDKLEDYDDVQYVAANFELSEAAAQKLAAG